MSNGVLYKKDIGFDLVFSKEEPLMTITRDKKIKLNEELKKNIPEDEYAKRMFECFKTMLIKGGFEIE